MKNKKILVLGIALILTAMIVGVAFSEEQQEHEYTVEVMYRTSGNLHKVTYTIWASSNDEAQKIATERCAYEKGEVASCGAAIATGRAR
jgi:hypothetical protein